MQDLNNLFAKFSDLKVMIIGDVMLDKYSFGKVNRISPEAPIPILNIEKEITKLGGAANVANNIVSMGAQSAIYSVVGDDSDGDDLNFAIDKQLGGDNFIIDDDRRTTVKHRFICDSHHMIRTDREDTHQISDDVTQELLTKIKEDIKKFDVVIFQDYDKGVLHEELIKEVISICVANNIPTIVDPKKRNFWHYENATLFKPNFKELNDSLPGNDFQSLVYILKDKMNLDGVLLTMSEKGVFINYKDTEETIPAYIREISDVSGAGDTVCAVAALLLALNQDPKRIASISNLAGGLACEHVGVVAVDKDKLLAEAIKLSL